MHSDALTVPQYIASLPPDRRTAIAAVRKVIVKNLPKGYEEVMDGMIVYVVPFSVLPKTYNNQPFPYAGLASQKNFMALYLMSVYSDPAINTWFRKAYATSGKKLNMGKSCIRFRKLDDLPLDLISKVIAKVPMKTFVANYHKARDE